MRLLITIIFFIPAIEIFSQSIEFLPPLTVNNGLSDNRVYAIEQDERGFIWIATANGLNRFDGNNYTIFNSNNSGLLHNTVYEIRKGPPHIFILATRYGAILLDTRTGVMNPLLIPSIPELAHVANDVRHVEFTSKNEIVLGTDGGIYVFDLEGKLISMYEASYNLDDIGIKRLYFMRDIAAFTNGDVLAATLDGYFYYDSRLKNITALNDLPEKHTLLKKFINNHINSYVFEINKKDQLFFIDHIAAIDSLYIVDIPKNEIYTQVLPFHTRRNIRWDSKINFHDDSLFTITTAQQGFYIYNYKNSELPVLVSIENAKNALCNFIYRDENAKYWIGTEMGVLKEKTNYGIENTSILPYTESNSYHPILATLSTEKKIWAGCYSRNGGLLVFDKKYKFLKRLEFTHDEINKNFIVSISHWSVDTILVGTLKKAFLVNIHNYKFRPFTIQSRDSAVTNIRILKYFQASNGESWISEGSSKGTWKINRQRDSIQYYKPGISKNNFPLRNASAMAEDIYGNVWMVNWMDGITRWNTQTKIFDTVIRKWPGSKVNYFLCSGIAIDSKNDFWFFINSYGLVKFDLKKNTITRIIATNDEADDNASSLLLVKDKFLWMNLRHSILAYNIETGKLISFSTRNGLPVQPNSSAQLSFDKKSEKILIGFTNHLTAISLKVISDKKINYPFYITGVKDLRSGSYLNFLNPLHLKNNHNDLRIEFSQINYDHSLAQPILEYKLRDDDPWTQVGSYTSLNLNNLSPGQYNLQIKEAGLFADKHEILDTMIFYIKPTFYQTSWFYLFISFVLTFIFYTFYRFRINQLKKVHEVKEKIASDLHDDIGSRLTHISMLSVIGEDDKIPVKERKKYLKKIYEEALASGEALDEIVRNIHVYDEELNDITARMRRYAGEMFDDVSIQVKMTVDEKISIRQMNIEKKKDLFLAYKEILNNIQKHAQAKNVIIMITDKITKLVLEIQDDGKGFNPREITLRNGIKNIKTRMNKWGGNVNVISEQTKGTCILIEIPY